MRTLPGTVSIAACAVVASVLGATGLRADPAHPRAVVELFTSQGCGRCPPADALFEKLSHDPDLVTLSYAVDYWDYLGWKDTAARPEFTQRQRAYAERRGDQAVYTPQAVIDGRAHVVGSDRAAIETTVAALAAEGRAPSVDVEVETSADSMVVKVGDAPAGLGHGRATVWLARYERARTVPIGKGENSGKTVTYSHLVRTLQPIGMWKGKAVRIELPRQEMVGEEGEGCAILVQLDHDGAPGAIVGARLVDRPAS